MAWRHTSIYGGPFFRNAHSRLGLLGNMCVASSACGIGWDDIGKGHYLIMFISTLWHWMETIIIRLEMI